MKHMVSREEYADLVSRRLHGLITGDDLAMFEPEPLPPRPWHWQWWSRRWWRIYGLWKRGELPRPGICPICRVGTILIYVHPMTQYGKENGVDQDYVGFNCRTCAEEYREYWQSMWDEYNGSRG